VSVYGKLSALAVSRSEGSSTKRALKAAACLIVLTVWVVIAPAEEAPASNTSKSFDFAILLSGTDTGNASALLNVRIPANVGLMPHVHTREDEVFLIKQGTFQFLMDGVCLSASAGATVYMPKEHMHTLKNVTPYLGELLLFVYPAGLDQYFRELRDLHLKMPQDFDKLNELSMSKYGITYDPHHDFHAGKCRDVAAIDTTAK
jgi:mannose-6-phosphate isomerase-like protein (cupin superfamily)